MNTCNCRCDPAAALELASEEIRKLEAELAVFRRATPVAWVNYETSCGKEVRRAVLAAEGTELPDGTLLYALPPTTSDRG